MSNMTIALAGCSGRAEAGLQVPGMLTPSTVALAAPSPRTDLLLQAVDQLLQAAGAPRESLKLVAVTRGPGSFTGIRNALACALGLAQGLNIPAHGFSSLLVQAARAREDQVLAVQPARKGWVYAQRFRRNHGWEADGPVEVIPVKALSALPLPVAAPATLVLPPEVQAACTSLSTVEALLTLAAGLEEADASTLVPFYVEDFPAQVHPYGRSA